MINTAGDVRDVSVTLTMVLVRNRHTAADVGETSAIEIMVVGLTKVVAEETTAIKIVINSCCCSCSPKLAM